MDLVSSFLPVVVFQVISKICPQCCIFCICNKLWLLGWLGHCSLGSGVSTMCTAMLLAGIEWKLPE